MTNLFIQSAANAVMLIAACDKALSQPQQDQSFWLDSKTKALQLLESAMSSMGMRTNIRPVIFSFTYEQVTHYFTNRLRANRAGKKFRNAAIK